MKRKFVKFERTFLAAAVLAGCLLSSTESSKAQVFGYNPTDLVLGFRKTGGNQANFELVVDIGAGSTYVGLTPGTSMAVPNFTLAQLTNAEATLANLNWSVLGRADASVPGYPNQTLWLTVPRIDVDTKTTTPTRLTQSAQQATAINILSIFDGALSISGDLAVASTNNTSYLVREPINDDRNLSTYVGGRFDPTTSTLQDTWGPNVEKITPASFTSPVRSDFYEIRPTGFVDPNTGLTTGSAYWVGYFQFNTDGTMTFTRATTAALPPAPVLSIARAGDTCTISFVTTNNAMYTCFYTNSSGLSQPYTAWPSLPMNITGDNTIKAFEDTTTDSNRFYRVSAW